MLDAASSNAHVQRLDHVACHSPAGWTRHGCGWRRGVWPPPVQSAAGTLPCRPPARVAPRRATQGHLALRQRPGLFPVLCNPLVYSRMPPCRYATLLPGPLRTALPYQAEIWPVCSKMLTRACNAAHRNNYGGQGESCVRLRHASARVPSRVVGRTD